MNSALRFAVILLVAGILLFNAGAYVVFRAALLDADDNGSVPVWADIVYRAGLVILALGVATGVTAAVIFLRSHLRRPSPAAGDRQIVAFAVNLPGAGEDMASLLNRAISLEYDNIATWERWGNRVTDPDMARALRLLGSDDIMQFDACVALVRGMGCSVNNQFTPFQNHGDLRTALLAQLQRERNAAELYQRAARLAANKAAGQDLMAAAARKGEHARLVQEMLARLGVAQDEGLKLHWVTMEEDEPESGRATDEDQRF